MKKLMIAAAAAMLGIAANAAAVAWNVGINEFDSNWSGAAGNIILATGGNSWTFDFDDAGNANGVINGDTTGIFAPGTAWTATITSELFKEDTTSGGQFTKSYAFTMPTLTGDPTLDGGTLDGLNADIGAAFQGAMGTLPTSEEAAAAGWTVAGGGGGGGGSTIPEPTSGLLLALGLAGLVLRRRV